LAWLICFGFFGCADDVVFEDEFYQSKTSNPSSGEFTEEADEDGLEYLIKKNPGTEETYSLVTESNLFHKDRVFVEKKNSETPIPEPKQATREIKDLRLVGTLSYMGSDSYAFIFDKGKGKEKSKTAKYKSGDTIGQYTVVEINSDHVILQTGDERALLKLKPGQGKRPDRQGQRNVGRSGNMARKARSKAYDSKSRSGGSSNQYSSYDAKYKSSQKTSSGRARPGDRERVGSNSNRRSESSGSSSGMPRTAAKKGCGR